MLVYGHSILIYILKSSLTIIKTLLDLPGIVIMEISTIVSLSHLVALPSLNSLVQKLAQSLHLSLNMLTS